MGASFGAFLRVLRQSHHLTLRQVEAQVNVSSGYLSQLEQGVRGVPNRKILKKLAEAYQVSATELFEAAEKDTETELCEAAEKDTESPSRSAGRRKSRAAVILSMIEGLVEQDSSLQPYMHSHLEKLLQQICTNLTDENKQRLLEYAELLALKQQHEARQAERDV